MDAPRRWGRGADAAHALVSAGPDSRALGGHGVDEFKTLGRLGFPVTRSQPHLGAAVVAVDQKAIEKDAQIEKIVLAGEDEVGAETITLGIKYPDHAVIGGEEFTIKNNKLGFDRTNSHAS